MVFNSQAIEAAGIWMGIELRGQECGVLNSLNGFFFFEDSDTNYDSWPLRLVIATL